MKSITRAAAFAFLVAGLLLASTLPVSAGEQIKGAYANIQVLGAGTEFVGGQLDIRVLGQSPASLDLALISNQANQSLKFIGRSSVCGGSKRPVTKRFELTELVSADGTIFVTRSVSLTPGVIRSVTVIGPNRTLGCNAVTMYEEMPLAAAVRPQAADDGIQDGSIGRIPAGSNRKGRGLVVRLNSTEVQVRASLKGLTAGHDYSIKGVAKACGQSFSSADVAFTSTFMNLQSSINVAQTKAMTQRKLSGLRSFRIKDLDTNTGWGCIPLTKFEIVTS